MVLASLLIDLQYDMLTTPITNDHFHTRINELISNNLLGSNISNVQVPPLEYLDTHLFPGDTTSSLLAFTSSWIDICSPDPLISGISKQILCMEVAYAVFCGIDFLFVQGPKLSHRDTTIQQDLATNNVVEYARTIQQCLGTGHRLQISIILPMSDDTGGKDENSAVLKTREQYLEDIEEEWPEQTDGFGTWDAWNAIRTFCNYHSRLYVGKNQCIFFSILYGLFQVFTEMPRLLVNFEDELLIISRYYLPSFFSSSSSSSSSNVTEHLAN